MINKINEVVNALNVIEKERLLTDGLSNLYDGFDNDESLRFKFIEGSKKYHKINKGTMGIFMIEIATGELFNIKGYGTPDKNKKLKADIGNIQGLFFSDKDLIDINKIKTLHSKQYNYLR